MYPCEAHNSAQHSRVEKQTSPTPSLNSLQRKRPAASMKRKRRSKEKTFFYGKRRSKEKTFAREAHGVPRPPWPPTAWRGWKDGASVAGERGLRGLHHMEREAGRMCLRDTSVKPKKPYFAASRPRCKCSRPERSSKNLQHELHQLQLNQSPAQASGPAVWCEGKE